MRKRGAPAEVRAGNARQEGLRTSQVERWMKRHADNGESNGCSSPQASMVRASSEPKLGSAEATFKTTYDSTLGLIPNFEQNRYELPLAEEMNRLGLTKREPYDSLKYPSGDHTTGVRSSKPHFSATSWDLGKGQDPATLNGKRHEVAICSERIDAKVHEVDFNIKSQEGDHCGGIKGKAPHFKSDLSNLGSGQGWNPEERYLPPKHLHLSKPIFFDKPDLKAQISQQGDCCLGIKANQPHYRSTSSDLGNIPGWQPKRYDFGPVANKNYRFTVWRE